MDEKDRMIEPRLAEFAEDYLEKIYYFCLKRTGSAYEAEDLSSDISLNIVAALRQGAVPLHFSAWVWQIARNRYSVWADRKRRDRESAAGVDIEDCEIVCQDALAEDAVIRGEELALLRRELSFISSDYRDIIIAYYIQDRKVQDIAASVGLPPGTVKSKLFRARKKLKEGMTMAREFGTKSFKPEEVDFSSSGSQPSGLPWRMLQRKLQKNILLEASGNPSTIEELAVELGTALPYMEEEVELLTRATLLKEVNGKYVTNFYIFDKESQLSVYAAQRKESPARSRMIGTMADDSLPLLKSLGVVPKDMSDGDVRWWAVMSITDYCVGHLKSYSIDWPEERANGETWGIVGFERVDLPRDYSLSNHSGSGSDDNMLWIYGVSDYGFWNRDEEVSFAEVMFLSDVVRNHRKRSSFSDSELEQWKEIEGRFAHADGDGNIVPDILVIHSDDREKITAFWEGHPLYGKLMENMEGVFGEIIDILKKSTNPILYKQLPYCASMQMFRCRMMTVHDEVESGRLVVPPDPRSSRIAMWLELRGQ